MPISACSNGVLAAALLTLLLLPAQYYVPEFGAVKRARAPVLPPLAKLAPRPPAAAAGSGSGAWSLPGLVHIPTVDLVFTCALLAVGLAIYLSEWIQRKIMERRITKLNEYLGTCVERLRAWDAQQEQLETTLRMVRAATSEYNLLLLLLLRQRRTPAPAACAPCAPAANPPAANCYTDKELDEHFTFFRSSALVS